MTGQSQTIDILRFCCPSCRVELTVPATLAGIEGPCPSCGGAIRAPVPEVPYTMDAMDLDFPAPPPAAPGGQQKFPALRRNGMRLIPEPGRNTFPEAGHGEPAEKSFQARRTIPQQEEPGDDTWMGRHRDQQRHHRRVRRVEKAAQSFLDSRGFKFARVALILLSGAMLAWLFQYLQTHQWQLPGMSPSMAEDERPSARGGATKAVGDDVNAMMGDDDTEIPPAASHRPEPLSPPATPVAGGPQ